MKEIDINTCIIFSPAKTLHYLELREEMKLDNVIRNAYSSGKLMRLKKFQFQYLKLKNKYFLQSKIKREEDRY